MKRQVENVLIVTVKEYGKMEKEKLELAQFKDLFVVNVATDLENRQFYQLIVSIVLNVKSA